MVDQPAAGHRREALSAVDRLFDALSDETRRAAVMALMAHPHTSSELARSLAVTPQALTRHLRVLRQSGLARVEGDDSDARLRIYRIDAAALSPFRQWLDEADRLWSTQWREVTERSRVDPHMDEKRSTLGMGGSGAAEQRSPAEREAVSHASSVRHGFRATTRLRPDRQLHRLPWQA